ncbi:hypothetical protein [Armatimonas sp.]|uniref:hypothetical protein n=1 Tax=Armatimonas sp. TaxID=1872638 RepID=UPI00374DDBDF
MPTIHTRPACRLFVFLARDAPIGIIFRHGPARLTQLILWHTDTDTFEPGDRHVGNFYAERGDLSPAGKLLIYVAANYTARQCNHGLPNIWTALCKPPWLTPLAIWPNNEPYYIGGLFASNTTVQINQAPYAHEEWTQHKQGMPAGQPPQELEFQYDNLLWNPNNQFFTRLIRNGWKPIEPTPQPQIFDIALEKAHPMRPQTLVLMMGHQNTPTYEVRDPQRKTMTPLPGAIWADWDQGGRLVYAQEGKLFTADVGVSGKLTPQEIADFTPTDRKRAHAPANAGQWQVSRPIDGSCRASGPL